MRNTIPDRAIAAPEFRWLWHDLAGDRLCDTAQAMPGATESNAFELVYGIVERIPRGRVATYGQISKLLDGRLSPIFVGWALHAVPESREPVPWHRVVNAQGAISKRATAGSMPNLQKELLEAEGVTFGDDDRIDLSVYRWDSSDST